MKVKGVDGIRRSGGGLRRVRKACKIEKKSVQREKNKIEKQILVETKVKEERDEGREIERGAVRIENKCEKHET